MGQVGGNITMQLILTEQERKGGEFADNFLRSGESQFNLVVLNSVAEITNLIKNRLSCWLDGDTVLLQAMNRLMIVCGLCACTSKLSRVHEDQTWLNTS